MRIEERKALRERVCVDSIQRVTGAAIGLVAPSHICHATQKIGPAWSAEHIRHERSKIVPRALVPAPPTLLQPTEIACWQHTKGNHHELHVSRGPST